MYQLTHASFLALSASGESVGIAFTSTVHKLLTAIPPRIVVEPPHIITARALVPGESAEVCMEGAVTEGKKVGRQP